MTTSCISKQNSCAGCLSNAPNTRSRRAIPVFAFVGLISVAYPWIFTPNLRAQSYTASLQGTVADPSGSVVPAANLNLENEDTGVRQTSVSDSRGYFLFASVPPGSYTLTVTAKGFQTFERKGMRLQVQQQANIDVSLVMGSVANTVQVTGESTRLDTVNATLGRVVDTATLQNMPLSDRSALNLIFLTPGVTSPLAPGLGWTGSNFVANGSRNAMSDVEVDGITVALHEQNGGATDIKYRPTVENVEELKVQTNSFSAEYGFTGGAVVSMVTRSGTNQLHGSLYETLQNSVLNANDFFANKNGQPLVPSRQNLFGGNLGGPVVLPRVYNGHDRTFFFFSQEFTRESSQLTTTETHPTALQMSGNFSQTFDQNGSLIPIYDPASVYQNSAGTSLRNPFPGNIMPVSRFSPVAVAAIKAYPAPNTAGNPFTNTDNFFASGAETYSVNQTSIKIDHYISDRQRLSARYSYQHAATQAPHFWGANDWAESSGGWGWWYNTNNGTLDYTLTLNPTTVLDLRAGVIRYDQASIPACGNCSLDAGTLGFQGEIGTNFDPEFNIAGYQPIGPSPFSRIVQGEDVSHLVGSLSKVLGKNTIKIGGEARLYRLNYGQPGLNYDIFSFDRSGTDPNPLVNSTNQGDGFASFLLGWGSNAGSGAQTTALESAWAYQSYGFYYQDDLRVTRHLTVNLGIRYELPVAEKERYNRVSWFDTNAKSPLEVAAYPNLMGGLAFGSPSERSPFETPKKNWAPRAGLAYEFGPGMVVRAGFGIFYGLTAAQDRSGLGTGFTTSTAWNNSLDGGVTQFAPLANPFPGGINVPSNASNGLLTNVGLSLGSDPIRSWDTTPYFEEWSFSIEKQLPANSVVEAAYSANRGVHLVYSDDANLNHINQQYYSLGNGLYQLVPNPFHGIISNPSSTLSQPQVQLIQLLRPYPQFTTLNGAPGPPITNSSYNALQLIFTKRYSNGLNFSAHYTWSKMMDDTSVNGTVGYLGGGTGVQNYDNLKLERSISLLDVPQFFKADFTYELPFGRGKHFGTSWNRALDLIAGGWQVNGIITVHSGTPLVPSLAGGNLPDATQRPNVLFNPSMPGSIEGKLNEYVNPAAFSQPAAYTFGTAPRAMSYARSPGQRDADVSVFKNFYFGAERARSLQFRAEAFNLTNTPYFAAPDMTYGDSTFGVISSTQTSAQGTPGFFGAGPRQIQFGLKLNF